MSEVNSYTNKLLLALFDDNERRLLKQLSKELEKEDTNLAAMWQYDKSLGGLGGYAMPSDSVKNPFSTLGGDRNLFRSVQYAKSGFIYYPHTPRHIVIDAGISLELTFKYILDHFSIVSRLKNKEMFGSNLKRLHDMQIITNQLYEACRLFGNMHNAAKHEITEDRERTFLTLDGLVAYFSLRKIHNHLLGLIDHPSLTNEYSIYND